MAPLEIVLENKKHFHFEVLGILELNVKMLRNFKISSLAGSEPLEFKLESEIIRFEY